MEQVGTTSQALYLLSTAAEWRVGHVVVTDAQTFSEVAVSSGCAVVVSVRKTWFSTVRLLDSAAILG